MEQSDERKKGRKDASSLGKNEITKKRIGPKAKIWKDEIKKERNC